MCTFSEEAGVGTFFMGIGIMAAASTVGKSLFNVGHAGSSMLYQYCCNKEKYERANTSELTMSETSMGTDQSQAPTICTPL